MLLVVQLGLVALMVDHLAKLETEKVGAHPIENLFVFASRSTEWSLVNIAIWAPFASKIRWRTRHLPGAYLHARATQKSS